MRIQVAAFAALKEALGADRVEVELPDGATGADLRSMLARTNPRWSDLIAACRLAQGVEFLDDASSLGDGDEVVLIPPVSGGGEPSRSSGEPALPEVLLTAEPLEGDAIKRAVYRDPAGAVVVFEGTVRSPSTGRDVLHLEYEAYEDMARAQMARILAETRERWPVTAVALHHRLGRVEVGEPSVVAAVSAPHRGQAFEACRHIIERLKVDVPIWKKELFTDGSVWVGAPGECRHDGEGDRGQDGPGRSAK